MKLGLSILLLISAPSAWSFNSDRTILVKRLDRPTESVVWNTNDDYGQFEHCQEGRCRRLGSPLPLSEREAFSVYYRTQLVTLIKDIGLAHDLVGPERRGRLTLNLLTGTAVGVMQFVPSGRLASPPLRLAGLFAIALAATYGQLAWHREVKAGYDLERSVAANPDLTQIETVALASSTFSFFVRTLARATRGYHRIYLPSFSDPLNTYNSQPPETSLMEVED